MLWPKGEELQRMAQSGKEMKNLDQIETLPLESTKLRLTMQSEEPGVVVAMEAACATLPPPLRSTRRTSPCAASLPARVFGSSDLPRHFLLTVRWRPWRWCVLRRV